ncbi:alkaline phosphatase D family protein [Streptomyces sp. TRM 70361]|uniref:alkaline phosphatase D family protein n=1 Tax=Streptomyces sp. TRM 70361 TaxID=3116553 RepID=UPI002E7BFC4C|nr:alkaline phosphatase D family protein [Streptomyces sp. TRM 70361]MEE1942249.1 alkaline phosphatase D family protein [Streptomyces sp. TRM 70361]
MTDTHAPSASSASSTPPASSATPAASAPSPTRRSVVAAGAATAALLPLAATGQARAAGAPGDGPVFAHGVASGDPLPDGVLLWTRVTPSPDAVPGSGRGAPVEVSWEIAEDRGFSSVVASGRVTATAASDHTVRADVRGLRPATDYHYRFTAAGVRSPAGRTRTAPADGTTADRLRFGVVSCAHYESGFFAAYRHLAARTDLDAVLHLGDYIYEYGREEFPLGSGSVRAVEPAHETVTLADYRQRHAHYKTDPDLRALHAAHPVIAVWDDHESANDSWSGGAENHTPGAEGDWAARAGAARQAYFEWMPVRPATEGTVHRRLRFGDLADLHLLDLRSFRDEQAGAGSGDVDDPGRTITGRAQLDWLKSSLSASAAAGIRWHLVGTSVMISPVAFGSVPAYLLGPLAGLLGVPREGLAVNTDQWDGYTDDRRELLTHLRDNRIGNTVFLTGDVHMAWANEVPVRAATYPLEPPVATEFVVTSVTSDNLDDALGVPPHTVSAVAEAAVRAANRHTRWVDMDSHGYGVLEVTGERAQMDYYALADRTDPDSAVRYLRSYRAPSGTQRVERAPQALR